MLVKRWALLRRALPSSISITKIVSLVICLCRLHNYCIRRSTKRSRTGNVIIPRSLAADNLEVQAAGGISLSTSSDGMNEVAPLELLNGGQHHDDTEDKERRAFQRRGMTKDDVLPRDCLHAMVIDGGFKRPTPQKWVGKTRTPAKA